MDLRKLSFLIHKGNWTNCNSLQ